MLLFVSLTPGQAAVLSTRRPPPTPTQDPGRVAATRRKALLSPFALPPSLNLHLALTGTAWQMAAES